ncbi:MAG: hypothetical protein AB7R69_02835 [Candidatus Babeliales bacterium]
MKPLYDLEKSFEENFYQGPLFNGAIPERIKPPKSAWISFCDYQIASPLGIAACPLGTSKGIALMSQLGFDVLTYKTVRSVAFKAHKNPNICYVACNEFLNSHHIGSTWHQTDKPSGMLAISNSFGNASYDWPVMHEDIVKARSTLSEGQILIVSVFGTEQKNISYVEDFAYTASLAQQAGAHIIELNLSCPNIKTCKPMHEEPETVFAIAQKVARAISIPFIIKVGVFSSPELLKKTLIASAKAGARGICGINTLPICVITHDNKPYFGTTREVSGLSGDPVRTIALDFVRAAQKIITQEKLDLSILATGGTTQAFHFQEFLNTGANIALSATGALWNPYLAVEYYQQYTAPEYNSIKKGSMYV